MPAEIEDTLKLFNRKERYWVVRTALGAPSSVLAPEFCDALNAQLGARAQPIMPASAWWAIDYHFDWLQAALRLHPNVTSNPQPISVGDAGAHIRGQQEDVDLIIAHGRDLILVEAKAFGSWSNSQLESKLGRLRALPVCWDRGVQLGGSDAEQNRVRLHFVLMSPNPPRKLSGKVAEAWPQWGRRGDAPLWVPLQVDASEGGFFRVNRCTQESRSDAHGEYWRAVSVPGPAR